jgi:hypothetical protein
MGILELECINPILGIKAKRDVTGEYVEWFSYEQRLHCMDAREFIPAGSSRNSRFLPSVGSTIHRSKL